MWYARKLIYEIMILAKTNLARLIITKDIDLSNFISNYIK